MATSYYKEDIKRITEHTLKQDVLNYIDDLEDEAVSYVKDVHSNASKEIIQAGIDTENTIWESIRQEIANKGYKIVITNDNYGNVTVTMVKG